MHYTLFELIKSDSLYIYNVTKDSISNKCCSFEFSINQRILKRNVYCLADNIQKRFLSIRSSY